MLPVDVGMTAPSNDGFGLGYDTKSETETPLAIKLLIGVYGHHFLNCRFY